MWETTSVSMTGDETRLPQEIDAWCAENVGWEPFAVVQSLPIVGGYFFFVFFKRRLSDNV